MNLLIFAQTDGATAVDDFLNSPLGGIAKKFAGVLAAIVIIYGLFKIVTAAAQGRAGAAFRSFLVMLLVGGALLDLGLTGKMLSSGLKVAKGGIDQVTDIVGGSDAAPGGAPAD